MVTSLLDRLAEEKAVYDELLRDNTILQQNAVASAQAETKAESEARTKDQFLALLAHELRNPITLIAGWIPYIKNRKLDDEALARATDSIERNVIMQTKLIDDLLDISRLVVGNQRTDREKVNLGEIVIQFIQSIEPIVESQGLQVTHNIKDMPARIYADPLHVRQIVSNLLSNALKFSNESGTIFINVEADDEIVSLVVKDTGKGIAPQFLERLFDLYAQEDRSDRRTKGGLGIGLALVKRLTELHGGRVTVQIGRAHV